MSKNYERFLYGFNYPKRILIEIYLETVRIGLNKSKYANLTEEILTKLREDINEISYKGPTDLPIITAALKNASKYLELVDLHPTAEYLTTILTPELANHLDDCVGAYQLSVSDGTNYNHYAFNNTNHKVKSYERNLQKILKITASIRNTNSPESVKAAGTNLKYKKRKK